MEPAYGLSDDQPTARFRRAVENHDVEGALATLAPDVVLRSPITDRIAFRGIDEMRDLFPSIFATIKNIHYFADIGDAATRALFYNARVNGEPVEEATRVELDESQRIKEITIFFRPLPGLATFTAAMAPRVARRRGWLRAMIARLLVAPLGVATRFGDRIITKLA
ncbi:MAG TPA: nuclear transport factor 2 family protein [Actinomycetota bacterium]|nr:nuclear transport factor 2 family protein [Actinomycetota bacterium]